MVSKQHKGLNVAKYNKVLIGPSSFGEIDTSPIKKLEKEGFTVVKNPFGRKIKKKELIKLLDKDVVGLIAGLETLDNEVISNSNLKTISRVGSGISNIDLQSLKKNKIKLFSVPNGPIDSVAELTIANIINLFRKIIPMDSSMKKKKWNRIIGNEIKGKNILVIGCGKIGQRVIKILEFLGANVKVVDPYTTKPIKEKFNIISLKKGLKDADLITLHSSGQKCILGKDEFKILKKGTFICNVSRGELISEKELIKSIKNNTVSGAWLDTFTEEPYSGELTNFKEVILTPHIGSYTAECRRNMESIAVNNLINSIK